jgi:hypothetical protein
MLSGPYDFDWNPRNCYTRDCEFAEYHQMHKMIQDVQDSVDAKAQAVLESQHAGSTDMIRELETQLRAEAELNQNFVREFKKLT